MKNTFLSILLLLISQLSFAQIDSLTVEWDTSSVSQRIVLDSIFENLDLSTMQTEYLLDYGAIINEPSKYNGTELDSTNIVRPVDFQGVYYTLDFAAISPASKTYFPSYDSELETQDNYLAMNMMPISIISAAYDRIDSNSLEDNRIEIVEGRYLYTGPNPSSPFIQQHSVLAATAKYTMADSSVSFIIPSELIKQNQEKTLTHLTIDFDNGQGPILVNFDTPYEVNYDTEGKKHILYTYYYDDNTTEQSHGEIYQPLENFKYKYVNDVFNTINGLPQGKVWWADSGMIADETFNGAKGKADVTIAYGCGNTKILKPLIVAPGIDHPQLVELSGRESEDYLGFLNWLGQASTINGQILEDLLENEGYDLIYVDYENGADYIERNAKLLKTVINRVNQELVANGSNEPITVLGISMGGVVARRALVELEADNVQHNVETYISFDSPHNGAYIPIGLQEMTQHVANARVLGIPVRRMVRTVQLGMDILENPASNQLLMLHAAHTKNNKPNPDPLHPQLMAEMDNFGFPQQVSTRGVQIRNISITNGAGDGTQRTDIAPNDRMIDFKLNNRTLVNNFTNATGFWASVLTGASQLLASINIDLDVNATPANGNREEVYKGTIINIFNPFGIKIIPIPLTLSYKQVKVLSDFCLECVPGGSGGLAAQAGGVAFPGLTFHSDNFTFMPSITGLAVNPPFRNIMTLDLVASYNPVNETWNNNESEFNNFASAQPFVANGQNFSNEGHTDWTTNNTQFFIDQVLSPFRYEHITSGTILSPIFTLPATEIYNFGKNTTDRIGSTTIFGTLSVNKNIEVGSHNGANSFIGDIPVAGSHFQLSTRSASCATSQSINNFGTIEIGDNSVSNTADLILTNGTTLSLRGGSELRIADNSSLIVEEGALLRIYDNTTIHLEGSNSKIIVKGQIRIESNSTFAFTKGSASNSGYLHLIINEHNQGEVFTGTGSPTVNITGTNAFSDEVIRVEGGTLNIPANFANFQITSGKINLVAGSTSSNKAQLDISSPIAMDFCLINGIGTGSHKPTGLITHGQSDISMPHLYMDNLDIGWYAKNNTLGNQPTIGYALIKKCVTGLVYEHIGVASLANVNTHTCETGIELHNYASGTLVNCNFTDISNTGLLVFNLTEPSLIHNLIDNNTFYNCYLGIDNTSTNSNSTTLKCTKFFYNANAMKSANGLNMSPTTVYNGYVGGDNSVYKCNSGIQLINNPALTMSNGQNNFYGLPSMTPYNFIYGSVSFSSINSTNSTIDVANNYWNPVPSSGSISSTGTSYCNLSSTGYFLGPHPTTFNLTPAGIILPLPNTTCFTVPATGEQAGGYIPKQKVEMVETFKTGILNVVPNPMENYSTLVIESEDESSYQITVLDAFGKVVIDDYYPCHEGVNAYRINLEGQRVGLYFVKIYAKNELLGVKKVIKINR